MHSMIRCDRTPVRIWSCASLQIQLVTRSVAGSFCVQSPMLVFVWALSLKRMSTEGGGRAISVRRV